MFLPHVLPFNNLINSHSFFFSCSFFLAFSSTTFLKLINQRWITQSSSIGILFTAFFLLWILLLPLSITRSHWDRQRNTANWDRVSDVCLHRVCIRQHRVHDSHSSHWGSCPSYPSPKSLLLQSNLFITRGKWRWWHTGGIPLEKCSRK